MFYEGDLQSGIGLAVQQSKAVLCFVVGHSQNDLEWEDVLAEDEIQSSLQENAVCLRLQAESQESQMLASFCPVNITPAVIVIRNGKVQLNSQSAQTSPEQLRVQLRELFVGVATGTGSESAPPAHAPASSPAPAPTQPGASPATSVPAPPSSSSASVPPTTGTVTTPSAESSTPPSHALSAQQTQRSDYIRMQKEREQKQRDERERIKQQIKADREERRRFEKVRKDNETAVAATRNADGTTKPPKSNDVRVQVRMFEGSTQRQTFPPTATISHEIRQWIDSTLEQNVPYNLKLILTPSPNRNIEAGEEDQPLADLGIKGSCTFVTVPVKGYVDSYADAAPGYVGSAVSGGYNLVTGTAGALFGGIKSMLGYGQPPAGSTVAPPPVTADSDNPSTASAPTMKIRTLADQRAEEARKDQQFYNGNQLNFEPRKDEGGGKDD